MLNQIVDLETYPLGDDGFRKNCKAKIDIDGVLVMPEFMKDQAVTALKQDGEAHKHLAYYTASNHNIYLKPHDPNFADDHPRNREIISSKGCITDDQIPENSVLRLLYNAAEFRDFLCAVLGEKNLYAYADDMSSINLHYAEEGKELGWHFDNSSFAITLMVQKPEDGGVFEYVKDVRNADAGEMNYALSENVLNGKVPVNTLAMDDGALVLFRGRNSMHRVTPTIGHTTRMLAVLAYNSEPNISLSESARKTFYGRV